MVGSCPACGTTRTPGALFCGNCGNRVAEENAPAPRFRPSAPPPGVATPTGSPFASYEEPAPDPTSARVDARRVPSGLTRVVQVAAVVTAVAYLAIAVTAVSARIAFNDYVSSELEPGSFLDWADADDAMRIALRVAYGATLGFIVLQIWWLYRAARAVGRHQGVSRTFGTGWAIGAWFIPGANLVLPWLVYRETERIADAATADRPTMWKQVKLPATSTVWWLAVIVGTFVLGIGLDRATVDANTEISDVRIGYLLTAIGAVVVALGSALCTVVVGRIARLDAET